MSAPFGNQNAKGSKGGNRGRKTGPVEKADAEALFSIWNDPRTKTELIKAIKSGTYSLKQIWMLKSMSGNEKFLDAVFKKLFPDTINIQGNLKQKSMAQVESDMRKILESVKQNDNNKRG